MKNNDSKFNQKPLTFASDYRKCSKCLMLNIVIV